MKSQNKVFIATSLDGFIADKNGNIDWLHSVPNPNKDDMGYKEFMSNIDALIMGRTTFETVCGFDCDWPYDKPVYVLSNKLNKVPIELVNKVEIVKGDLNDVLDKIHQKEHYNLYIDGGKTIQSFLQADLINEITITIIPIILGGGVPLFSDTSKALEFECVSSKIFIEKVVQNRYKRTDK